MAEATVAWEEQGRFPARIQAECWEADGMTRLLIVAQGALGAGAMLAVRDDATGFVRCGNALVEPCASHHDRDALASAIPLGTATVVDLVDLEAFGDASGIPDIVQGIVTAKPSDSGRKFMPWNSGDTMQRIGACGRKPVLGEGIKFDFGGSIGFTFEKTGRLSDTPNVRHVSEGAAPLKAPGSGEPMPGTLIDLAGADRSGVPARQVRHALAGAFSRFSTPEFKARVAPLGPVSWMEGGYAFFGAPGRTGQRRLQAAQVYPALAAVIMHDDKTRTAVEAGRPFEAALLDVVAGTLSKAVGKSLNLAMLRRLRGLPGSTGVRDLVVSAALATSLPIDWVPSTSNTWKAMRDALFPLQNEVEKLGLDMADVAAHVGVGFARGTWTGSLATTERGKPIQPGDVTVGGTADAKGGAKAGRDALRGAVDMVKSLERTLLRPLRDALLIDGEPFGWDFDDDGEATSEMQHAGRMLLGGKTLPGIDAMQARWHERLSRLNADLPLQIGVNAWPAAFEPYTSEGGYVISCLTTEPMLKAEGARGDDADGLPGLDHCVGGYAQDCFTASSHIASVRKDFGDGLRRVSTLEFRLAAVRDVDGNPVFNLREIQHKAHKNEPPPAGAAIAVAELADALGRGLHKADTWAIQERSAEGFSAVYNPMLPGAVAQAFEAWRPLLTREMAHGGVAGLARKVAEAYGEPADEEIIAWLADPEAGPHPREWSPEMDGMRP